MISTKQQDFVLRSPSLDDVPTTVELINASLLDRTGRVDRSTYSVEQMRTYWEQPDFDYSKNIRLAEDNGQIIGYCGVFSTSPGREYEITACTDPTQRGRGIGTSLMQWAESRIIEKHSLASSGEQVLVHCNNLNKNVAGTQLLLDLGYQRARSFYEMKIEMTDMPAPPVWPAGITVRKHDCQPG